MSQTVPMALNYVLIYADKTFRMASGKSAPLGASDEEIVDLLCQGEDGDTRIANIQVFEFINQNAIHPTYHYRKLEVEHPRYAGPLFDLTEYTQVK